jgi:hypothetical protein
MVPIVCTIVAGNTFFRRIILNCILENSAAIFSNTNSTFEARLQR